MTFGQTGPVTAWITASFAREWFADAQREALQQWDAQRARREILFSVTTVESYLFEWVRDEVLERDFARVDTYFPPGGKLGIWQKWKAVPKRLLSDGLIAGVPSYNGTTWERFGILVDYRDGLVHARASRPKSAATRTKGLPVPSVEQMLAMGQGGALDVVRALISELNIAAGKRPPDWL